MLASGLVLDSMSALAENLIPINNKQVQNNQLQAKLLEDNLRTE